MEESLSNTPVIVVGIMIGVDIVLRVLERVNKAKNNKPISTEFIKQTDAIYWKINDIYRHVRDSEKMIEKIKEKIPQSFDKITELTQELLLELKKISKEMKQKNQSSD